ncbi:MAG TPA: response regulator, partial [Chromatiales bacterium]|nr:response regulator [Chromatiales bacterium]
MSHPTDQIWIIDDDASIRWVLEKSLEKAGFAVRSFERADGIMEALDEAEPAVLVSDIRMPGMSGMDLLREVKARHPELPVIIMTAHSDLDSAVNAFQEGAFEYLPKPFDVDEAVALVSRAAQTRTERSATASREEEPTPEIIGKAPAMQEVFRAIGRLSRSNITVLINGESGTGKELVARAIHDNSPRSDRP